MLGVKVLHLFVNLERFLHAIFVFRVDFVLISFGFRLGFVWIPYKLRFRSRFVNLERNLNVHVDFVQISFTNCKIGTKSVRNLYEIYTALKNVYEIGTKSVRNLYETLPTKPSNKNTVRKRYEIYTNSLPKRSRFPKKRKSVIRRHVKNVWDLQKQKKRKT